MVNRAFESLIIDVKIFRLRCFRNSYDQLIATRWSCRVRMPLSAIPAAGTSLMVKYYLKKRLGIFGATGMALSKTQITTRQRRAADDVPVVYLKWAPFMSEMPRAGGRISQYCRILRHGPARCQVVVNNGWRHRRGGVVQI